MKNNLDASLEASGQKRPDVMVMDKMTPSKRTGKVPALICPVPENHLSQPILVSLFLEVTELDAAGLARLSNDVLNKTGTEDIQPKGIGVDGKHEKKGFKAKLIELFEVPGFALEDKEK